MAKTTHPKCGKTFPGGDGSGHCPSCCETFIGLTAYDAHRVGAHGEDRRCEIQPYELTDDDGKTRYGHWMDERGYYRHGRRLTKDERAELWPTTTEFPADAGEANGA